MRRYRLACPLLGLSAALLLAPFSTARADHRLGAIAGDYSAVAIDDLYMFRDPPCTTANCSSPNLVVAMTTQAFADPLAGPTYHFEPNARYRLNFTSNANATPTAYIDFVFSPFGNNADCPAGDPPCQSYTATFVSVIGGKTTTVTNVVEGLVTEGTWNATHLPPIITTAGSIRVFAGPREDPFFFDLVGWERTINSAPAQILFTGVDAFKGRNVNAIVLEFPVSMVFPSTCTGTTTPVFGTPCGAWVASYVGNFDDADATAFEAAPEGLRQIDRVGNPAVETLFVPPSDVDAYGFGQPKNDVANFGPIILGQIAALATKFAPLHPADVHNPNPNLPLLQSVMVPDILRFAAKLPDGFPNGRQLSDRTTDILISLALEFPGFTDGTSAKTYCSTFPYLGPPLQLSGNTPFEINPQSCP